MSGDLFDLAEDAAPRVERLAAGTVLLHRFASAAAPAILTRLAHIIEAAPLRRMLTPGGRPMSVETTSCGTLGWVSDAAGYRYAALQPWGGAWPHMPHQFLELAQKAAAQAGFPGFVPDSCLINRYAPGTRLSLHQDRDERDFGAPIVSVSLGLPAIFLLGGMCRADRAHRMRLSHGDVLVWGGPDRLRFHGVLPLAAGEHPLLGAQRINLTFRKAG